MLSVICFHKKKYCRKDFYAEKCFISDGVCFYKISVKEGLKARKWDKLRNCFNGQSISAVVAGGDYFVPE